MKLRLYQLVAVDRVRALLRDGQRTVLVAPTGAGKTVVAGELISGSVQLARRVLFLAHREELIQQASARLNDIGVHHGAIQADRYAAQPTLPVQVASVQTLARRQVLPPAHLIIIDEAHRAMAATYGALLARYPGVPVVGLTAFPARTDGRGLGDLFQSLVVAATPRELLGQGFLVPVKGFAYDRPDLASVRVKSGDYDEGQLELVMGSSQIVGNVVEAWRKRAGNRRTVVFAATIAHSRALLARFQATGVAAAHIDGTTPSDERARVLAALRTGALRVVCNVGLLTEGWDLPQLEVCVLARPTLSTGLYLQMVGRILRPACLQCGRYAHPAAESCDTCGSREIKRQGLLHDHAGCVMQHGLPDLDREFSLTVGKRRAPPASHSESLTTCTACLAIYPNVGEPCPGCGAVPAVKPRVLREVIGTEVALEEVKQRPRVREDEVQAFLRDVLILAARRAYPQPRKWACLQVKAKFGFWPSARQIARATG